MGGCRTEQRVPIGLTPNSSKRRRCVILQSSALQRIPARIRKTAGSPTDQPPKHELVVKLFERERKGVRRLTIAGEAMIYRVRGMMPT
jgi:hypothetical protein